MIAHQFFGGAFLCTLYGERHLVRKNHRERFFMSDSEPVEQPTGKWAVILLGTSYNQSPSLGVCAESGSPDQTY